MSDRSMDFHVPTTTADTTIVVSAMHFKGRGFYVTMHKCVRDGMFNTIDLDIGGPGGAEPHTAAPRFSRKRLEEVFADVKHRVRTGHTEDRWVKKALAVADHKGLVITWPGASELAAKAAAFKAEDLVKETA